MKWVDSILGESGYMGKMTDPATVYHLALDRKSRVREGEACIAADSYWALVYAANVVKGRWPEGEYSIARDPLKATRYASNILKRRWPEAERFIIRDPYAIQHYLSTVVKGPWPEAEAEISKNAEYSFMYAVRYKKQRFPAGEKSIANSNYQTQYLKRFPEAKDEWYANGWMGDIDWMSESL